jgi:hypothetical protein
MQHGKPHGAVEKANRRPVTDRPGAMGWRRGSYYLRSWVTPAEGRSLSSELTLKVAKGGRLGSLATPISVQKLQTALHVKA